MFGGRGMFGSCSRSCLCCGNLMNLIIGAWFVVSLACYPFCPCYHARVLERHDSGGAEGRLLGLWWAWWRLGLVNLITTNHAQIMPD